MSHPTEKGQWLEEYSQCGCTCVAKKKSQLTGYCAYHGNDWSHRYKLPTPVSVGHSKDVKNEGT